MRAKSLTFVKVLIFLAVITSNLWAAVPPPPVNQYLGVPDSTFANLVEDDCRFCHNQTPPIEAVDPTYLPDRHHNLLGQSVPFNSAAPYAQPGQPYACLSCHSLGPDPVTGQFVFQMFRDCALCHRQLQGRPTVHHAKPEAQAGQCVICHGSLVNDMADGHYIPSYRPSLVTPWPSNKPNGGPQGQGNCNFCHNTVALPFFNPAPVVDPASGVLVFRNADTHHATGFVLDAAKCVWCHNITPGINNALSIRTCQNCHGVASLHNIQHDDAGDGIIPGQEKPGFGHIGANSDCVGCHGFSTQSLSAPGAGPVTPFLSGISQATAIAGQSPSLTLYGNAFVSRTSAAETPIPCQVRLTDSTGRDVLIDPAQVTPDRLHVQLPGDLAPGNYHLRVLKQDRLSNPLVLAVRPAVVIDAARCRDGLVDVTGSGFGGHDPSPLAGTGIRLRVQAQKDKDKKTRPGDVLMSGEVLSWSDARILARFASCGESLSIESVFGSASAPLARTTSIAVQPAKKTK
ncbi:hypothetical protein [Geoalkalibacter sp.]|uniref:hypothetical protein n=1 Tax=Geoalkalibacter sp. TaxID=3041440 RepID=UPI00272DCA0A|nr:hypothetical protein [Geoalkalibacter sp.]